MIQQIPPSIQDTDPLDARLARAQGIAPMAPRGGLGPLTAPHTRTILLLPLGLALGPSGMNLISAPVLSFIDPLVSVALCVLGVFLGMAFDVRRADVRMGSAVFVEAGVTALVVGAGALVLHAVWPMPGGTPGLVAVLLGICAAASFAPATGSDEHHSLRLPQPGDLNSILAIIAGAVVLGVHRTESLASAVALVGGLLLVALALAGAGWLLVRHPASDRERHTFVAGILLLLGGAAAYLGHSALFVGLVAGLVWGEAGGPAGDRIARDVRHVQHPLVVLLLLVAGARLTFGVDVLALGVAYVLCRTAGKLVGAWLLARHVSPQQPPVTADQLLAPGIVGLALALNVFQAAGDHALVGLLLTVVALGVLATDLLWITTGRREVRA